MASPCGLEACEYRGTVSEQTFLQALNLSQAKNGSIVAIVVCAAAILLIVRFISSLVVRLTLSVVFAALGVVIYSQRASLLDCAERVTQSVSSEQAASSVTCTFFGKDVTISLDSLPSQG